MNTEEFHKVLFEFSTDLVKQYQEDELNWALDLPIHANFPWYYVHYTIEGTIAHPALHALEGSFRSFCQEHGGAFEGIIISANTRGEMNVKVKLLWNGVKRKPPPDPEEYHNEGCDGQHCACSLCGACQFGNPCICYAR